MSKHRTSTRERVVGLEAVTQALESAAAQGVASTTGAESLQCVLLPEFGASDAASRLAERARTCDIPVHRVAPRRFDRLRGHSSHADILALVGRETKVDIATAMARGGAVWLLTGIAYPGNVGFAIRTAEVSGADALYVDNDFDHAGRREATRASMRADRFMPVGWERAETLIATAKAAGKRVVGVEDVGTEPPWRTNLTGSVLLIVGGEADGIPSSLLAQCDAVTRLPMSGFIASYNLQTAVASIAIERFRQLEDSHE